LVLISRSGALRDNLASGKEEQAVWKEINSWPGATVVPVACDVGSRRDLIRLFNSIEDEMPPVVGIIHSAGMVIDTLMVEQDWERTFQPVLAAKSRAAYLLDEIVRTREYRLEAFLMFSSAAGLFGARGQSNHAAANAILDALAKARRAEGQPYTSVNWGGWAGIGAAIDKESAVGNILSRGMGLIPIAMGEHYIERVLLQGSGASFGVVPINWPKFASTEHETALLHDVLETYSRDEALDDGDEPTHLYIPNAPEVQRTGKPEAKANSASIQNILAQCGFNSMTETFVNQGMDSLSSIEVVGLVRQEFGVKLVPTFYLDIETGADLQVHLGIQVNETLDQTEAQHTLLAPESFATNAWIEPLFKPACRLFCFAYAGGHPNVYEEWLQHLPGTFQLCPISMPGFGKQTEAAFWNSVSDLAGAIEPSLPTDIPFALVGSCLGAIVSFEVARKQVQAGRGRLPMCLFAVACSAPHKYAQALRLLYSDRLKENTFLVPRSEQEAAVKFRDLPETERKFVVDDLHHLGFFKDEETMHNLTRNQTYFEHVMAQLTGQMQLAERYQYTPLSPFSFPIKSISGSKDETIPAGWPKDWGQHTNDHSHVDVHDGGHYIIQTHPKLVAGEVVDTLQGSSF